MSFFLSLNISKIFIIKYNFTMYNVLRVLIIFLSLNSFSLLGNDIKIIRDAETESFFEELAKPILNTAKINEDSVSFYLDHQKYINAFVTGGYNIFFTTEMIINMDSVNQVAAVIAHEVGHISGGILQNLHQLIMIQFL